VGLIGEADYRESVEDALLFLEGKTEKLAKALRGRMDQASQRLDFEEAARLRDLIATLGHLKAKPRLTSVGLEDQDIFGHASEGSSQAVYVFVMREGKVRRSDEFLVADDEGRASAEILRDYLLEHYSGREVPGRILVPFAPADRPALERILRERAGRRVRISVPSRGPGRDLVGLAAHNAEILLREKGRAMVPLEELRVRLGLGALPVRIEGFDISNTGATEAVGSMVSFVNGRPAPSGYRKYKIKSVEGPNDVAALGEVLRRRYGRAIAERSPLPDLVLVDGGKPQFGAARTALDELGLDRLPLASLAKSEEIVFISGRGEGLRLDRTSSALKLLQRVRDEAHRFAIAFHRRRRARKTFE
jgi:excinuclease ABC subunit C